VNARLSELRTADRAGYGDVSWSLALRLGLFLSGTCGSDNVFKRDLVQTVVASGYRDPGSVPAGLIERAARWSDRMKFVGLQVAFEDDPADFRSRHSASPNLFRHVRPPERADIVLDSDGSEFIGYERSATTGEVVGVERDELTAPLRRSRGRRRWNNEPVRRARLADATVTPLGLVLFGKDSILDFEFANLPNRSGSPIDGHQVGSHRELILSSDRSAVLSPFPVRDIDRGALLSGLPNMANYGHFIFNGVSKFPLLRAGSGAGGSVVVPGERESFHDAIIAYCGLNPASFIFTEARQGIRAGCLDVYSEAPMGKWPYNLLAALRAELPQPPPGDGPRRIFLARPETARCSLTNEAALIDLLAGFGFAVVRPELLPFSEQVAALEAAEVIVAPHGSALATLMFCHGTKRIVEIETKTSYRMALYNFLNHQAIRVPALHPDVPDGTLGEYLPYAVDLDIARAAVAWAVGG